MDTWDKAIIDYKDLIYLATYILYHEHTLDMSAWIHQDKDHIYCLFTPGKVPKEFIYENNIPADFLHDMDKPTVALSNNHN